MQRTEIFHRPELVKRLADHLVSEDGASGVFITGPRRTGKSTFIREDLVPWLQAHHCTHVVYVDLWEDRAANPGDVIVAVITNELLQFESFMTRAAKEMGVTRLKVANLELDLDKIGLGKGETLTKALTVLAAAAKKPVTLIIDEAQHSQVSEQGRQAMYAIKAARDAMNASSGPGFRLLATGSNADKLATLVDDKDQAFYQAQLMKLPPLGDDYLKWLLDRLVFEPKPSLKALSNAFVACNHRPESLRAILRELALDLQIDATKIDEIFEQAVQRSLSREKQNFFHHINSLGPLDSAVLRVMARDGMRFAPYHKSTFVDYELFMLVLTGDISIAVSQSSVQAALERLRAEKLIWRAGRGAYFIEDQQHTAWIDEEMAGYADELQALRRELIRKKSPQH